MIAFIKKLLGIGGKTSDFKTLLEHGGATIVDVRTPQEFASGHIKNSINIPLNALVDNLKKINKEKPIITCCASGMRSASARAILKANGCAEVHNGGGWASLQQKIA